MAWEQEQEIEFLKQATGASNLLFATSVQMTVDTKANTVSYLGDRMPNLYELKLCNSTIGSIRDVGTALKNLTVLWVKRCELTALDGLSALPQLRELYAAFNDIADLEPLQSMDQLQVLDLEANTVSDPEMIYYLAPLPLRSLALVGNPLAQDPTYRPQALDLITTLTYLDDVPVDAAAGSTKEASSSSSTAMPVPLSEKVAGSPEIAAQLDFINSSIKTARLGIDSLDFQDADMTTMCDDATAEAVACAGGQFRPGSASVWLRTIKAQTQQMQTLRESVSSGDSSGADGAAGISRHVYASAHCGRRYRPRLVNMFQMYIMHHAASAEV